MKKLFQNIKLISVLFLALCSIYCSCGKNYTKTESLPKSVSILVKDRKLKLQDSLIDRFMTDFNNVEKVNKQDLPFPVLFELQLEYEGHTKTYISSGGIYTIDSTYIKPKTDLVYKYWNIEEGQILMLPQEVKKP
ncbi:hypothetical protein GN157_06755 [Flavobacterium rakeshii]|uniref:Lipoprotein n=1 Tax=Flavobacterium rakeshii TaxID=1038845 RepID=A0A6N8HBS9_9FLAO|nr:hypothetical protein [Flavobacterium rakeshii]MUV03403.1 hypothetical protein [Flavobacterium rakeshii]